jgi:hypothetical protein
MASQEGLEAYVNDPSNISAARKILKQEGNENPTSEDIGVFLTEEYQKNKKSSNIGSLIGQGLKKAKKALGKKDGGMMNKKLTRTVPPQKGPNSQGMRGTGIAIRGTKFKGVF